jgi:phosphate/sulfate permease
MNSSSTLVLIIVVVVGLGFDFTNGFHDAANAMATSIATGALKPRVAVAISAAANLVGAFLSLAVAATIAKGIVNQDTVTIEVVFAGLAGGVAWNVATWYFSIPSSSSHALLGGVIGATMIHAGASAVIWSGVASKVFIPALFAPTIACAVAALSVQRRGTQASYPARGDLHADLLAPAPLPSTHAASPAPKRSTMSARPPPLAASSSTITPFGAPASSAPASAA